MRPPPMGQLGVTNIKSKHLEPGHKGSGGWAGSHQRPAVPAGKAVGALCHQQSPALPRQLELLWQYIGPGSTLALAVHWPWQYIGPGSTLALAVPCHACCWVQAAALSLSGTGVHQGTTAPADSPPGHQLLRCAGRLQPAASWSPLVLLPAAAASPVSPDSSSRPGPLLLPGQPATTMMDAHQQRGKNEVVR
jgi:hypothetical protein